MKTVKIKGLTIGSGRPKICVPIVAKDVSDAIIQAEKIETCDLVEIRGDYIDNYNNVEYVIELIKNVKKIIEKPVIFTFRTGNEGGERNVRISAYVNILKSIIKSKEADFVDVELFSGDGYVGDIIKCAKEYGIFVIISNHDFASTPSEKELINRLNKMQELGADIAKIAMMPKNMSDVYRVMAVTSDINLDIPVISMSMGKMGMISRIAGELYGSSVTFGCAHAASAPGQLNASDLSDILGIIHKQN